MFQQTIIQQGITKISLINGIKKLPNFFLIEYKKIENIYNVIKSVNEEKASALLAIIYIGTVYIYILTYFITTKVWSHFT